MPSRRTRPAAPLVAAAFLAAPFLLFFPALDAPFLSDDQNAIVANELVTGPLEPVTIFSTFSWWGASRADAPGYRPLATLTFALNHGSGQLAIRAYHVVNLLLHGLVAWLTCELGWRLGLGSSGAMLAGLIFLVLPIHSEAVIWTVGRAELLAAAGFAGSFVLLLEYRRRGGPLLLAAAALALLAGLFGKENAVALLAIPPALALLMPQSRLARRRDARSALALAAALVVYLAIRWQAGPLLPDSPGDRLDNPLSVLPPWQRILGALSVLGRYLVLSVWPHPLSIDYSYDALGIRAGFAGDVYTAIALVSCVLLALAGWRSRRRCVAIPLGLVAAAAAYAIVSNTVFLIGTIMGERLFYLPSLGLCIAAAAWAEQGLARERRTATLVAVPLLAATLAYATVDFIRARQWRSQVEIFASAARAYPDSARAQMELATAYGREGRTDPALAAFARATEILPEYAAAWYNRANLLARQQRYVEAAEDYERALQTAPRLAQAWYNLSLVRQTQGELAAAAVAMERAAQIAPADPQIRLALADLLLASNRIAEAIAAYDAAAAAGADPVSVRVNRGVARQRSGGCEAALPDYLAAVAAAPSHPTARTNAIACLQSVGRLAEAQALARRTPLENRGTRR